MNDPQITPETPEQQNPEGTAPEQTIPENEVFTAREVELQRQLAAMTAERDQLRNENQRIYRQFSGLEDEKEPEKTLDDWLLDMLNNGGRLPGDYKPMTMKEE